jgi:hypothetical protein
MLVRQCFVPHPSKAQRLVNVRLLEEREKQLAWSRKSAKGGRKSGKSRRLRRENLTNQLRSSREPKGNISSSSSSSINKEIASAISPPYKPPKGEYPKAFETWWSTYPKRVGKQAAYRAWTRAGRRLRDANGLTTSEAVERMQTAAEAFAASPKGRGEFCPHPATWLNQARYDDDRQAWQEGALKPAERMGVDLRTLDLGDEP